MSTPGEAYRHLPSSRRAPTMTVEEWVSVAALVLAIAAVVLGLVLLRRLSDSRRKVPPLLRASEAEEPSSGPPAFVVNPIKVPDLGALYRLASEASERHGLPAPLWYETRIDDPGLGQARQAVAEGASVVVAAGGDGTVRAVAGSLAGTSVPMALIPMGTGNLLARNLDLPLGDVPGLIDVALTGHSHAIDVGFLRADGRDGGGAEDAEISGVVRAEDHVAPHLREHCFLVMAGLGFDAAMVAGADHELKRRVGWFAYFLAGARHLHGRRVRVRMTLDGERVLHVRLRSLLFANCGRLPGGIVLFPDAELDDGLLEVAGIDTKGGVFGWASLFGKVLLQGMGFRRDLPAAPGTIQFYRARTVEVLSEAPEPVQVDGDLVGEAVRVSVTLRPGALHVRTR